jgi:hypothetical protein
MEVVFERFRNRLKRRHRRQIPGGGGGDCGCGSGRSPRVWLKRSAKCAFLAMPPVVRVETACSSHEANHGWNARVDRRKANYWSPLEDVQRRKEKRARTIGQRFRLCCTLSDVMRQCCGHHMEHVS